MEKNYPFYKELGCVAAELSFKFGIFARGLANWGRGRSEPEATKYMIWTCVFNASPLWLLDSSEGSIDAFTYSDDGSSNIEKDLNTVIGFKSQTESVLRNLRMDLHLFRFRFTPSLRTP